MQIVPIQSHTNTQTDYQNLSVVNLCANTGLILVMFGVFLTLRIVIKKEQRAKKLQQQIIKLEKIYLLEAKDNNLR
jgi:hypothetical protein